MKQDKVTKRVYNWEEGFSDWNEGNCSLKYVRQLIGKALKSYSLKPIPVKGHPRGRTAYYEVFKDDTAEFRFPPKHKNSAIALHEAAHHIADTYFGQGGPEHSAEWLGIYMWLMAKYKVAPRVALESSAESKGLEWAPRMSPGYVTRITKKA